VFLYWVFIKSLNKETITRRKHLLFNIGLYVAMLTLILGNVARTSNAVWTDINMEMSSSRAFGEFLNSVEPYRDAIIVPEPDFLLESLPYYAKNRIYLPREHRFGTTVSWTTEANYRLSLGELLSVARGIKTLYGQSVLIVLGHWHLDIGMLTNTSLARRNIHLTKVFRGMPMSLWISTTVYGDEKYRVYTIR